MVGNDGMMECKFVTMGLDGWHERVWIVCKEKFGWLSIRWSWMVNKIELGGRKKGLCMPVSHA